MRILFLIFFALNSVLLASQTSDELNFKEQFDQIAEIDTNMDSLETRMDSLSNHSDSLYNLILKENKLDSLRLKFDKEYRMECYAKIILGPWTGHETENASISFESDSVFYVDALKSYNYKIENDSLKIFFGEAIEPFKILRLTHDSLVIEGNYGIDKYERFTND